MHDVFFTFRSLTAAQQGRTACYHHGITAAVVRSPMGIPSRGCGFALRVHEAAAGQVSLILHLEQVSYERVYRLESGRAEEVAL